MSEKETPITETKPTQRAKAKPETSIVKKKTGGTAKKQAPAPKPQPEPAKVSTADDDKIKNIKLKDIDPDQYVTVKNGFQGRLIYKSKRTGERFVWDSFGDEQEMTLQELKNAKNSSKPFFENNWFMFDDGWVIDYLGVGRFYKHAIRIEDFDEVFDKSPEEIRTIIGELSEGQKKSLAYRARTMIADGKIDSNRVITALEETLNIKLIER